MFQHLINSRFSAAERVIHLTKNLQAKLMMILVLLIITAMAVVGVFLVSEVSAFYRRSFIEQQKAVLESDNKLHTALREAAKDDPSGESIFQTLTPYFIRLGIDDNRILYLLTSDGKHIKNSISDSAPKLEKTHNLRAAISGVGKTDVTPPAQDFMDYAYPLSTTSGSYIIYVKDVMQESSALTWVLIISITRTLFLALLIALILSYFLSKTITQPIQELTVGAKRIAGGDFSHPLNISSGDEIGTLTETFNNMAAVLASTLDGIQGEKNKLQTIFEYMTDGVAAFSSDGMLMHINNAAQKLGVGLTENSSTFDDMFFPLMNIPFSEIYEKTAKEHLVANIKIDDRIYRCSFATFGTPQQGGVVAVSHDITEQERIDRSRREFIANVSHELRTPLTNVKSYTETVLDTEDLPGETRSKFLSVVVNEADRMIRIVKDLLVLSRLDSSKMELRLEKFHLPSVLTRVYEAMQIEAKKRSQLLTLEADENIPAITGDKERIEQVFINIVSNAIKYTPDGGQIKLSCKSEQYAVHVSISDTGIGIPSEDLPRIFERFYRVDKARSREMGGTGLGLAIAKELIEAHGGVITVDSIHGKGTTVVVTLPTAVC